MNVVLCGFHHISWVLPLGEGWTGRRKGDVEAAAVLTLSSSLVRLGKRSFVAVGAIKVWF